MNSQHEEVCGGRKSLEMRRGERERERECVVWRALVAPHSLCQILWCVGFQSLSMSTVPECLHGDECPWHKRGRCLFKHCAPPPVELTGGGSACRAAVAGPSPCSPETGSSGHVERRRTHTASRERHSRDDDRAHPGRRCDSATDYGRAPGAHLGAYVRTDRRSTR